ncbi:MAG: DNA cytosine methyltransferase [Xanthomonadaceae bacterium]|nr:DNA cytosine methyltransferase [Xanthomonadaceae bacterium]
MTLKSVELFAGAGGLAMGVSLAGFQSQAVVEWDRWACQTMRHNRARGFPLVGDWPIHEGDVREFDWNKIGTPIDLIAGGPPCQPFSMAGKHTAHDDKRDMFPAAIDVVRALQPSAFIFENVKGLTRPGFANYYQYILLRLEFPNRPRGNHECWRNHFERLQEVKTSNGTTAGELVYNVVPTLVNAADYGCPQRRERVFIVGFKRGLGIDWSFPRPSHNRDALLYEQWITGRYWDRHGIPACRVPAPPEAVRNRISKLNDGLLLFPPDGLPWRTVRDALRDLPDPRNAGSKIFLNHKFQDGARPYPGHTGSPLDLPAKTLKAGDHGVPGGENMMVRGSGQVRYFTAREAARLQGFPDGYDLQGSWSEIMRQLGNAVPVPLARVVASSVAEKLVLAKLRAIVPELERRRA